MIRVPISEHSFRKFVHDIHLFSNPPRVGESWVRMFAFGHAIRLPTRKQCLTVAMASFEETCSYGVCSLEGLLVVWSLRRESGKIMWCVPWSFCLTHFAGADKSTGGFTCVYLIVFSFDHEVFVFHCVNMNRFPRIDFQVPCFWMLAK